MLPPQREVMGGNEERRFRISQILNYDTSYANGMSLINSTPFLADSLNPYFNNSTDWQDLFFRSTSNQTHNVNRYILGGTRPSTVRPTSTIIQKKVSCAIPASNAIPLVWTLSVSLLVASGWWPT